jgi:hypothetical protein
MARIIRAAPNTRITTTRPMISAFENPFEFWVSLILYPPQTIESVKTKTFIDESRLVIYLGDFAPPPMVINPGLIYHSFKVSYVTYITILK